GKAANYLKVKQRSRAMGLSPSPCGLTASCPPSRTRCRTSRMCHWRGRLGGTPPSRTLVHCDLALAPPSEAIHCIALHCISVQPAPPAQQEPRSDEERCSQK